MVYEGSPRLTGVAYSGDGKTMFVADSGTVLAMRMADPSKKFNLRDLQLDIVAYLGGEARHRRPQIVVSRH